MKQRRMVMVIVLLAVGVIVTGCNPSTTTISSQIATVQKQLVSYQTQAEMTIRHGDAIEKAYVATWYKSPGQYRIALFDGEHHLTQTVVRNENGVYLLTPNDRIRYRMLGDFRQGQAQWYLYDALLAQLMTISKWQVVHQKTTLLFQLPVIPSNPIVKTQSIQLVKKTYAPQEVVFYDQNKVPVIAMHYTRFTANNNIANAVFQPTLNVSGRPLKSPAMRFTGMQGGIYEPTVLPYHDYLSEETEQGNRIFLRYNGSQPFIIVEQAPSDLHLDLGRGTIGSILAIPVFQVGHGKDQAYYWTNNGLAFALIGLTQHNMAIEVIHSLLSNVEK